MTDADIVREALKQRQGGTGSTRNTAPALAALDALIAERDEAHRDFTKYLGKWRAAEARVTALEAALREIVFAVDEADYASEGANEAHRIARAALAKEDTDE